MEFNLLAITFSAKVDVQNQISLEIHFWHNVLNYENIMAANGRISMIYNMSYTEYFLLARLQ